MNKQIKLDRHRELCEKISVLYKKKNADYGDSVGELYEKLGDITLLTRISDKYYRLMSLLDPNRTEEPNFESIDDTILDLANYSIIWLMERELKQYDSKLCAQITVDTAIMEKAVTEIKKQSSCRPLTASEIAERQATKIEGDLK